MAIRSIYQKPTGAKAQNVDWIADATQIRFSSGTNVSILPGTPRFFNDGSGGGDVGSLGPFQKSASMVDFDGQITNLLYQLGTVQSVPPSGSAEKDIVITLYKNNQPTSLTCTIQDVEAGQNLRSCTIEGTLNVVSTDLIAVADVAIGPSGTLEITVQTRNAVVTIQPTP